MLREGCGILDLPPLGHLILPEGRMHDLYLLDGELELRQSALPTGTFLRHDGGGLRAGPNGAQLLALGAFAGAGRILRPEELDWVPGGAQGMRVAALAQHPHPLMLVAWSPGTRVPFHPHPRGEEFWVLRGELRDWEHRYPAGTNRRMGPGEGHAPFAEVKTLILLRNGHLEPQGLGD